MLSDRRIVKDAKRSVNMRGVFVLAQRFYRGDCQECTTKTVKEKCKAIEMLEGAIKLFYKRHEISEMQNRKAV